MQKYQLSIDEGDYVENKDFARLTLEEGGKVAIPAEMLELLGFEKGQKLVAHHEDGRLIIETRDRAEKELLEMFAHLPQNVSWSEELIQERRKAAERENES